MVAASQIRVRPLLAGSSAPWPAGGRACLRAAVPLQQPANNDVANVASLQRGARNFVNYCLGCHSAKYVRYNQLARDLGMTEEQVIENLMFARRQAHRDHGHRHAACRWPSAGSVSRRPTCR